MRRKPTTLQRIDGVLFRALKKRHIPFHQEDRRLVDIWERAVGPQITAQSRPQYLKRGVLYVKVSSPAWMHQLHFLKQDMIAKVKTFLGNDSLRDIRFSIGQIPPPRNSGQAGPPPLPSAAHLTKRDSAMLQSCLDTLADPELRDIIRRVMIKEITRRRAAEKRRR